MICCEKCNPVIPGVMKWQMGFCNNKDCECHTERASKPPFKDVARFGELADKIAEQVDVSKITFEEEPRVEEWDRLLYEILMPAELVADLEAQITNQVKDLLTSERSRLKGVAEGMRKDITRHIQGIKKRSVQEDIAAAITAYNTALDDIIKAI